MEGIPATIVYIVVAAIISILLWLIFKFKKPAETILEIADPAIEISKHVVEILIEDEEQEEETLKYVNLLQEGVKNINRKKDEIQEKLGPNASAEERHDAYTEAAIEVADKLAETSGVKADVLSKTGAKTAIELILNKLPSEKNEVTYIDLKEAQTH